jgi:organic radical activating enzyme
MKSYKVNEIFFSIQGEGARAGTANVFVRFAKCNLKCATKASAVSPGGWNCDTEFETFRDMTEGDIVRAALDSIPKGSRYVPKQLGIIFTGGEPALQLDVPLLVAFHQRGFFTAIETNGTMSLNDLLWLDWVTVSPKLPDEKVRQRTAEEVKIVVTKDSPMPTTGIRSTFRFVSPAFADDGTLPPENLARAIEIVGLDPSWRLSVQQHKGWGVR